MSDWYKPGSEQELAEWHDTMARIKEADREKVDDYLRVPQRWVDAARTIPSSLRFRCVRGHVSGRTLRLDQPDAPREVCLACYGEICMTCPEDEDFREW